MILITTRCFKFIYNLDDFIYCVFLNFCATSTIYDDDDKERKSNKSSRATSYPFSGIARLNVLFASKLIILSPSNFISNNRSHLETASARSEKE